MSFLGLAIVCLLGGFIVVAIIGVIIAGVGYVINSKS